MKMWDGVRHTDQMSGEPFGSPSSGQSSSQARGGSKEPPEDSRLSSLPKRRGVRDLSSDDEENRRKKKEDSHSSSIRRRSRTPNRREGALSWLKTGKAEDDGVAAELKRAQEEEAPQPKAQLKSSARWKRVEEYRPPNSEPRSSGLTRETPSLHHPPDAFGLDRHRRNLRDQTTKAPGRAPSKKRSRD